MADNPASAKPKHHRGGLVNLLFNVFLFLLDIALTLFLFLTPLFSAGAYGNFALHEYIFGVLYVIARIILSRVKHNRTTDILYLILRIIGITGVAVYYVVLFNFGDYFGWFYPVRKAVYIAGNYSDAAYFDFLPDSIPDRAEKYRMTFVPPTSDKDKPEKIDIHFYTDVDGAAKLRETAQAKGIAPVSSGTGDILSETAEPLLISEPGQPDDLSGAEIYRQDGSDGSRIVYLIHEQSGYCRIYWSK